MTLPSSSHRVCVKVLPTRLRQRKILCASSLIVQVEPVHVSVSQCRCGGHQLTLTVLAQMRSPIQTTTHAYAHASTRASVHIYTTTTPPQFLSLAIATTNRNVSPHAGVLQPSVSGLLRVCICAACKIGQPTILDISAVINNTHYIYPHTSRFLVTERARDGSRVGARCTTPRVAVASAVSGLPGAYNSHKLLTQIVTDPPTGRGCGRGVSAELIWTYKANGRPRGCRRTHHHPR